MGASKLIVNLLRLSSRVVFWAAFLLLLPLLLPFLDNAGSYPWVRAIYALDDTVVGGLRKLIPTRVSGIDFARYLLMVVFFLVATFLKRTSLNLARAITEQEVKKRYEAFRKGSGLAENSKAMKTIREKMETMKPGDAKSREELIELMIQTKKSLDAMMRNVAFLALDVVGSTRMKVGEDAVDIEYTFKEYKKVVENAMRSGEVLKSAWTPDGVMICLNSVDSAIRVGQAVLRELPRFNREVKTVKTEFKVRAGVNAGRVHFDKATPMEEMSDHVIDVAGHMQKYAPPDGMFIAKAVLDDASLRDGFRPADTQVDGFEVFVWSAQPLEEVQRSAA